MDHSDGGLPVIPIRTLTIGEEIGKGRFKRVQKGFMGRRNVVVMRYAHKNGDSNELDILKILAKHGENAFVPHVFGTCQNRDAFLLVAELAIWGSLKTVITESRARVTVAHKMHVSLQVAGALAFLETLRIVHADVSSRNVLVFQLDGDPSNTLVKVTDFGLSVALPSDRDSMTKNQPRAIRWCSPETVSESKISHRADAWSLGTTLWEIFSNGVAPWINVEKRADVTQHLCTLASHPTTTEIDMKVEFPRPASCPVKVHEVILSCLRPQEQERACFMNVQTRIAELLAAGEVLPEELVDTHDCKIDVGSVVSTTAASGTTTPTMYDLSPDLDDSTFTFPSGCDDQRFKATMTMLKSPRAHRALGEDMIGSIWKEVQAAYERESELAELAQMPHEGSTYPKQPLSEHAVQMASAAQQSPRAFPPATSGRWLLWIVTGNILKRQEFESEEDAVRIFRHCNTSCPRMLRNPAGEEVMAYHWNASYTMPRKVRSVALPIATVMSAH